MPLEPSISIILPLYLGLLLLLLSRFSRVLLFATPWIAAYQAPLSMGFSRQEYWSGVPLPSLVPRITRGQMRLYSICFKFVNKKRNSMGKKF